MNDWYSLRNEKIYSLWMDGTPAADLAERFRLSEYQINNIIKRQRTLDEHGPALTFHGPPATWARQRREDGHSRNPSLPGRVEAVRPGRMGATEGAPGNVPGLHKGEK